MAPRPASNRPVPLGGVDNTPGHRLLDPAGQAPPRKVFRAGKWVWLQGGKVVPDKQQAGRSVAATGVARPQRTMPPVAADAAVSPSLVDTAAPAAPDDTDTPSGEPVEGEEAGQGAEQGEGTSTDGEQLTLPDELAPKPLDPKPLAPGTDTDTADDTDPDAPDDSDTSSSGGGGGKGRGRRGRS